MLFAKLVMERLIEARWDRSTWDSLNLRSANILRFPLCRCLSQSVRRLWPIVWEVIYVPERCNKDLSTWPKNTQSTCPNPFNWSPNPLEWQNHQLGHIFTESYDQDSWSKGCIGDEFIELKMFDLNLYLILSFASLYIYFGSSSTIHSAQSN